MPSVDGRHRLDSFVRARTSRRTVVLLAATISIVIGTASLGLAVNNAPAGFPVPRMLGVLVGPGPSAGSPPGGSPPASPSAAGSARPPGAAASTPSAPGAAGVSSGSPGGPPGSPGGPGGPPGPTRTPTSGPIGPALVGVYRTVTVASDNFTAEVAITNRSGTAQTWRVTVGYPGNVGVLTSYTLSDGGAVSMFRGGQVVTFSGGAALAAGTTVTLAVRFAATGTTVTPTACTVNFVTCTMG